MTNIELREMLAYYPDDMEVAFADYQYGNTVINNIDTETVPDAYDNMSDIIILSE